MRIFLCLISFIIFSSNVYAENIEGYVTKVIDGDTIYIDNVNKIRLKWIDAPEMKQDEGIISQVYLYDLIFGKKVIAQCNKKDLYGRNVCVIIYENENINEKLVKEGYAWSYTGYSNKRIDSMQNEAMKNKLGIWKSNTDKCEPWKYRKNSCK